MGVRIIIAEDDEHIGYFIKFRLEKLGYAVTWKADGDSALEAVREELPDLVLLDIMMPGLNGVQVLEQMKKDEAMKDIPVVMLSGKSGEDDIVKCLEAGAEDYVVKPFKPAELMARIQRIVPIKPGKG